MIGRFNDPISFNREVKDLLQTNKIFEHTFCGIAYPTFWGAVKTMLGAEQTDEDVEKYLEAQIDKPWDELPPRLQTILEDYMIQNRSTVTTATLTGSEALNVENGYNLFILAKNQTISIKAAIKKSIDLFTPVKDFDPLVYPFIPKSCPFLFAFDETHRSSPPQHTTLLEGFSLSLSGHNDCANRLERLLKKLIEGEPHKGDNFPTQLANIEEGTVQDQYPLRDGAGIHEKLQAEIRALEKNTGLTKPEVAALIETHDLPTTRDNALYRLKRNGIDPAKDLTRLIELEESTQTLLPPQKNTPLIAGLVAIGVIGVISYLLSFSNEEDNATTDNSLSRASTNNRWGQLVFVLAAATLLSGVYLFNRQQDSPLHNADLFSYDEEQLRNLYDLEKALYTPTEDQEKVASLAHVIIYNKKELKEIFPESTRKAKLDSHANAIKEIRRIQGVLTLLDGFWRWGRNCITWSDTVTNRYRNDGLQETFKGWKRLHFGKTKRKESDLEGK